MIDKETRIKIERTREKRLFREALVKKKLLSKEFSENLNSVKLPSFAEIIDKENNLIKCKICLEETHIFKFKKHLHGARHQLKIKELKRQIKLDEEKEANMMKNLIDKDEFFEEEARLGKRMLEENGEIQDPLEGKMQEENNEKIEEVFEEKNKIDLPKGFFDDKNEFEKFENEEKKRIRKLKKKVGIEEVRDRRFKGVRKEDMKAFLKLEEDVKKIENGELDDGSGGGGKHGGGLGRKLIQKDADFLVDRVKNRLERFKKLRELKKKNRG